jgi:hypothetical protein
VIFVISCSGCGVPEDSNGGGQLRDGQGAVGEHQGVKGSQANHTHFLSDIKLSVFHIIDFILYTYLKVSSIYISIHTCYTLYLYNCTLV